jgi:hypothetical protein
MLLILGHGGQVAELEGWLRANRRLLQVPTVWPGQLLLAGPCPMGPGPRMCTADFGHGSCATVVCYAGDLLPHAAGHWVTL